MKRSEAMMQLRRLGDGWSSVALVGSAVTLAGCTDRVLDFESSADPTAGAQDPQAGPPQLIDVRFLDGQTLQLTYSEPMADPAGADPSAFRLSMAIAYDYAEYNATSYVEPQYYNGTLTCERYCYGGRCYDYCYGSPGDPVGAISLALDPDEPTRLRLGLQNPVTQGVCGTLDSAEQFADRAGLFLHYTDDRAGVTDATGDPAPPLAEHWALTTERYAYLDGSFTQMDPFLPIPCDR